MKIVEMKNLYPILSLKDARAHEDAILCSDPARTARAMENAGRAIGRAIHGDYREIADWVPGTGITVLCGKGLNTGDAFVACDFLNELVTGLQVRLVMTEPEDRMNPVAAKVLDRLRHSMGRNLESVSAMAFIESDPGPVDIVLDALYGLGFSPPLREKPAKLLRAINNNPEIRMRTTIDLPSGIGMEAADPDSFVADFTYIPGVAKEPCLNQTNVQHVGRIRFLEIDPFRNAPVQGYRGNRFIVGPDVLRDLVALRPHGSDKRTFGHCLVMGGSRHMPGAVAMAALGALHGGAGLLTTAIPATVPEPICAAVPESMWRFLPVQAHGGLDIEAVRKMNQLGAGAQACLIGPGLIMDRSTTFVVSRIVRETPLPLVLDASALTEDIMAAVLGRPTRAGPVIVTPHRGEFARISGYDSGTCGEEELLAFSRKFRVFTLLKGSPNLISDGGRVLVLPAGGPVLARGGSGDILAGILTALLARMPGNPLEALCQAVAWHGAAADSLAREQGSLAVRTTDLLPHLAKSLRFR